MKPRILLAVLLFLHACSPLTPREEKPEIFKPGEKHIVIMHPTEANLERFLFLFREGIFPLPEDYRIVGVYHSEGTYDYSRSEKFIREQNTKNIALMELDASMDPDKLFEKNELTDSFREIFSQSEGIIFFGGPDLPPATYHKQFNLLTVVTDPNRHYLELSFLFHLLGGYQDTTFVPLLEENPQYRILGICLGMQTMNVASGGTMIQDIPSEVYGKKYVEEVLAMDQNQQHRNYYTYYRSDPEVTTGIYHQIRIEPESRLSGLIPEPEVFPFVLSSHHQAVSKKGKGFRATAWSMDGKIVEAMEHEVYPNVIGIQFHPEIPSIFEPENKITFRPGEEAGYSFMDLYPGDKGLNFHRNFWAFIGATYHNGEFVISE